MIVIPLTWLCLTLLCAAVPSAAFQPMPKLRLIDRQREFLKSAPTAAPAHGAPRKAQGVGPTNFGNDFLKEYYGRESPEFGTPPPLSDQFTELNFETEEIRETVDFIEFKMAEVNALIKECIDRHFMADPMAHVPAVKLDCVGNSYQVLIMSYKEGMRRVKDVLVELIKVKLPRASEDFTEEVAFLVDLLDQLVDSDFKIEDTLKVAKKASKYYVSPRLLDRIIQYAQAELIAFAEIQNRLRGARNEVRKALQEYEAGQEEEVRKLQQVAPGKDWNRRDMLNKLEHPAEYVGDYLSRPKPANVRQISQKVDSFLRSRQGAALVSEVARKKGFVNG